MVTVMKNKHAMHTQHPKPSSRVGVLLTNLGTPDAPTPRAVRRYLGQFLSDPRVVTLPRWLWLPLLHGFLLWVIARKSARNYAKIWDKKHNDSPLRLISQRQAMALQKKLGKQAVVALGMRYGNPSVAQAVESLIAAGCTRIIHLPLYPQYSAVTTASNRDEVNRVVSRLTHQPTVQHLPPYYDHPGYIAALVQSIEEATARQKWTADRIVLSYHGIPQNHWDKGDPYPCHCYKTTRLITEALGLDATHVLCSFQSRFGKQAWVKPYTADVLRALPATGVKKLVVVTPAFSADCIETLEEIAETGRHTFMEAGGQKYLAVPCLNDSPAHIDLMIRLIKDIL